MLNWEEIVSRQAGQPGGLADSRNSLSASSKIDRVAVNSIASFRSLADEGYSMAEHFTQFRFSCRRWPVAS